MAKKYKSNKLVKQEVKTFQKPASAFGKHANRLADARIKKISKLSDTQKRLLETKKNNKMIKISKKAKKFALLDQDDEYGQQSLGNSFTHKGVNIRDLKDFDDVNFNESDLQDDEQFAQIQDKMNFAGFEATDNLLEQRKNQGQDGRQKTKGEIYKQIIQKSKAYKMFRQQQYEQNLNMAKELDEGFGDLVSQLKFRNKDQKLLDKLENRDCEYDKLMNELKDDQRVVSNKIVEKNQKYTQKLRKKKNDQLNKIMRESDGEQGDIRGWVDGAQEDQQQSNIASQQQSIASEEQGQQQEDQGQEEEQQHQSQGSYDQIEDINLSSQQGDVEADQQQQEDQPKEIAVDEDQQSEQDEEDGQDSDSDQQQEQVFEPSRSNNKFVKNLREAKQSNSESHNAVSSANIKIQNMQALPNKPVVAQRKPQKKVKLNTIE